MTKIWLESSPQDMCRLSLFAYGKPYKSMISKNKIYGAILHFLIRGDIESGGRQCTCIALVILTSNKIPKSECEIDNFLQKGTSLYHILCSHGGFMLVTEFPELYYAVSVVHIVVAFKYFLCYSKRLFYCRF
jgi:hypothetical protein